MSVSLTECIEAERLRRAIYAAHGGGCCWHVVLDDGEARFAEKIVILDSRLIDTLLAIPL